MESLEKRVFLICPVRDATKDELEFLDNYVNKLESDNFNVHYPKRNTIQNYRFGFNICSQNRLAIEKADEVHIYFNPSSNGSFFDIGMTFMAEKPLYVINKEKFKNIQKLKDISRFILKYSMNLNFDNRLSFYEKMVKRRNDISNADLVKYLWKGNTSDFLFDFGMSFMAKKSIRLKNREDVKPTLKHKSFENVLLVLDKKSRRWTK